MASGLSFGGFGSGVVGGAVVRLLLDDSAFQAGLSKDEAQMRTASSSMGSSASKFGVAAKAAFAVAGLAAVKFASDSIAAYMESEQVLAQLQNTINTTPALVGETTEAFQEQATALQNLTGYQDEEILKADDMLARFKLTGDQIRDTIPLVLDYARKTGIEVPAAAEAVGKALLGNTRALKTLGIEGFVPTGDRAVDLGHLMDQLKAKVGGAAEAFGKTTAGQMAIFQARLDDAKEEIGKALIPVLTTLIRTLQPLIPLIAFAAENLGLLLAAFAAYKAVTFLPDLLLRVSSALAGIGSGTLANSILSVSESIGALSAPAIVAGIVGLAAGFTALAIAIAAIKAPTLEALNQAVNEASGSQAKWTELTNEAAEAGRFAGAKLNRLAHDYLDNKASADQAGAAAQAYAYNEYQAGRAAEIAAAGVKSLTESMREQRLEQLGLAGGLLGLESDVVAVKNAQEALRKGTGDHTENVIALQKAVATLAGDMAAYNEKQKATAGGSNAAIGALVSLGRQFGLTKADIISAADSALQYRNILSQIPSRVETVVVTRYETIGSPPAGSPAGQHQGQIGT